MSIQREIEQRGLPTVLITLLPENSLAMGPPRAIHPVGFPLGHCTGWPGEVDLQRRVVLDALQQLVTPQEPGQIHDIEYQR